MAVLNMIRANDALNVNPPAGEQYLAVNGSNWLWTVTAIHVFLFLAFIPLTYTAKSGEKIFHYIFTIALLVGSLTYYASASDLAWVVIGTSNGSEIYGATRQIFFAKYINWVVSFPAISLALGLLSGVSWATIVFHVFLAWTWVLSYLSGALITTSYKWGFFAIGTVVYLALAASTLVHGTSAARRVDAAARDHTVLAAWTNLLWLLYPIAWGLSDGGNRIGVTSGWVFFGVLDVLLVPVIAIAVTVMSRKWDYGRLNIAFTQYGRVRVGSDLVEKKPEGGVVAPAAV